MIPKILIEIIFHLFFALLFIIKSALNMVEKKRIFVFLPFFIIGLAFCYSSGFMIFGFYEKAHDINLALKLIAVVTAFFIIWERKWD